MNAKAQTKIEQAKVFFKNNLMELILITMISAFWMQYNEDQKAEAEFRRKTQENVDKINDRQQIVAHVLYYDPDTDKFFKDIVYEWIKSETRGQ